MVGVGWLAAVIIGGFAGWIASAVMKTGTGIIANIILGIVGAVVLNAILVAAMGYTYGGLDRPAHRRCGRGDHPHLRLPRGHEPQPDVRATMTPAKKAFVWVFLVCVGLGVLLWLVKLVAPDAVSMTWNDTDLTGLPALALSAGLSAFFGLILALIVAGVVKLVTRTPSKG